MSGVSFWSAFIPTHQISILPSLDIPKQVASEDMRLFVEVLQNFCDDSRELAEVRGSEAKLKSQLNSAQKQLKGQDIQVNEAKRVFTDQMRYRRLVRTHIFCAFSCMLYCPRRKQDVIFGSYAFAINGALQDRP